MLRTLVLQNSLSDTDDYYDDVLRFFAELQTSTVEVSSPTLDFFTFKESLHYLGLLFSVPTVEMINGIQLCSWNRSGDNFKSLVGLVYLQPSQNPNVPHDHVAELSMGLVLRKDHRKLGLAPFIVREVVKIAFQDPNCHRIQAVVIDSPSKPQTLSLFVQCGFSVEGTRRRSFYGPYDNAWKDATYLALLDTDYTLREARGTSQSERTLWDEMFARHQRETEQLDRWESQRPLKRSHSTETLRPTEVEKSTAQSALETTPPPKKQKTAQDVVLPPAAPVIPVSFSAAAGNMSRSVGLPAPANPFPIGTASNMDRSQRLYELITRERGESSIFGDSAASTSSLEGDDIFGVDSDSDGERESDAENPFLSDSAWEVSSAGSPPRTPFNQLGSVRFESPSMNSIATDGDTSDGSASSWDNVSDFHDA